MKIWHAGAAPNPSRVDGASRTIWLLALEQARLGHQVSLLLDDPTDPEGKTLSSQFGLNLLDLSATALGYSKQIRRLLDTDRPHLVHMHSVFIPRQAILANCLRDHGIPYVITPHGGLAKQVLARGRLKKSIYSSLRERPRFMGSAAILLVTPSEEKPVRAYLPDYRGSIRWMPNPVEFSALDPHRWLGLTDEKRVVFLGRFDVLHKGIDILIEIARLLPEFHVDLYGAEDPKTREWLARLKAHLPNNVRFHDPVFRQAKAETLSKAGLYVQPSRWEGFPVSVAECLYLGVPSAISETLDLAELFFEHDLGLALSLNPPVAAAQIRETMADRPRLRSWSQRGRDFALQHFAPAVVAAKHVSLYQEVLGEGVRSAPSDRDRIHVAHGNTLAPQ